MQEYSVLMGLMGEYGFSTVLVIVFLYGTWKVIIPALLKRWDEFEKTRSQKEEAMHTYYRSEIKELQSESRGDKLKLLEAFQENTVTISRTNDLLVLLAKQLEDQAKELTRIKELIMTKEC